MEKDAGVNISRLKVDGGASANDSLLEFQADILHCEVARPKVIETTALGAACLAGLNCGFWKDIDDIKSNVNFGQVFKPKMEEEERVTLLNGWAAAVRQALTK
jgi:glycerol kinase